MISLLMSSNLHAICSNVHRATVREQPTTKSNRVASLSRYTPFKILKRKKKWFNIKGYNFKGWIYSSLVSESAKCMTIVKVKKSSCSDYGKSIKRRVSYLESFKVMRMEIGCNFVEDKYGRKFWISSLGAWPQSSTKMLNIP
jgi:hypothetical protein